MPLDTAITNGPPAATTATGAAFAFDTAGSGPAGFECRLDGAAFAPCTSPASVAGLAIGPHTFEVRSTLDGLVDATPAVSRWAVTGQAAPVTRFVPPVARVAAPSITGLHVSPARFAVSARGVAERAVSAVAAPKGTAFRFTAATAARVVYTIEALKAGRRSGRRCVAPTRSNRRTAACTRAVLVGRFASQSVKGANRRTFSGRIGTRRLAPGSHRATLVATTGARRSPARSVKFTVVAR